MKKIILMLFIILCCTGCKQKEQSDEKLIYRDLNNSNMHMTEKGLFFAKDSKLLFFDINSKMTVYVCDKAECDHKESCNAEISGELITCYDEKIYYFTNGNTPHVFELRVRNIDGNDDSLVATWTADWIEEAVFWDGLVFCRCSLQNSESFNAETGEKLPNNEYIYSITLKDGAVEELKKATGLNYLQLYDAGGIPGLYAHEDHCFYEWGTNSKQWEVGYENQEIAPRLDEKHFCAWGDYSYGRRETEGREEFFRTSMETGDEEVIFASKDISFIVSTSGNRMLMEKKKEDIQLYYYDSYANELKKIENASIDDVRINPYIEYYTEYGVVLRKNVFQTEKTPDLYDDDYEWLYISMEDLFDQNAELVSIHYFEQ